MLFLYVFYDKFVPREIYTITCIILLSVPNHFFKHIADTNLIFQWQLWQLTIKGCCKKTSILNFYNFGLHFLKENDIYIHFYFLGYWNSKGLAIIPDFTAIKNRQMANVWKIDSVRMRDILKWFGYWIKILNFQHLLIFIAQGAVKSYIIAIPEEFSYPLQ